MAQQVLAAAKAIEDEMLRAEVLSGVALALAQAGEKEAAARAARQALAAAEAIGDEWSRVLTARRVAQVLALALAQAGENDQAPAAAEAIGDERARAYALTLVAQALALAGEKEALQGEMVAAEAIGNEAVSPVEMSWRVGHALAAREQSQHVPMTVLKALNAARLRGRTSVFYVLRKVALTLAEVDGGQILRRVYQKIMEVEDWWGSQ